MIKMPPYWINCLLALLLLSQPPITHGSKLHCNNMTTSTSCSCLEANENSFEMDCAKTLGVKYIINKTFDVTCNCKHDLDFPLEPIEQTPEATICDPLTHLASVVIQPAETLWVRYCNASSGILPIQELINKTKPTTIRLRGMAFANDLIEPQQSGPEIYRVLQNVTSLALQDNQLRDVPYDMLKDMTELKELTMRGNDIKRITGPFSPNLLVLEMADSNITYVSPDAFVGLTKLRVLMLFVNNIKTLDVNTFDVLEDLLSLELMNNKLQGLQGETFSKLQKLELINLSFNQLTELPENLFWNNTELTSIRLKSNQLTTLPELIFRMNKKLTNITLDSNKINYLPDGVFQGLEQLGTLALENNQLVTIKEMWFQSLGSVIEVTLQHNLINTIEENAFNMMRDLRRLDLSKNQLQALNLTTFLKQEKLRYLNLAHNLLEYLNDHFDRNLIQLEHMDLSFNLLTHVPSMFTKVNLKKLNMRGNSLTSFDFHVLANAVSNVSLSLADNKITVIQNMREVELITALEQNSVMLLKHLNIAGNPLRCDYANYDLFRYFNFAMDTTFRFQYEIASDNLICASPEYRAGQPFYDKSYPVNPCGLNYTIKSELNSSVCDFYHVPRDNMVKVDCSARNLTEIPILTMPDVNLHEIWELCYVKDTTPIIIDVNLRENRIKHLQPISFVNINVTVLDVSFNNLSALTWIPHGLKTLNLDHNAFSRINQSLLEQLSIVTLNNNPWICDCETVPLWIFLGDYKTIPNKMEVKCVNSQKSIRKVTRDYLCPTHAKLIITLVSIGAAVILIPAIFLIFFYKYNQEIKVWLFAHNMCLWFVREEDLDKDKIYDAFISFSQKDEDFIADHLMPRLEQIPDPYKLCVHMRNWIPGEAIAKQVADSVLNSKRTIVVLSPSFLESVWGKMEFRSAHTTAITEGIARVIIIIYGDLDLDDERIDEELKVYLKTNTYIKWGDPWFWDKLKYALPHRKCLNNAGYVNRRFESVTVNLDKMDKINQNLPANVINGLSVNPPVDPLLLKVHPLDINTRCVINTPPAEKGIV